MRQAAILTSYPLDGGASGGVERYNLYLEALLKSLGYTVDVYAASSMRLPRRLKRRGLDQDLGSWWIGRLAARRKYDLVVSHGFCGWGYTGSAPRVHIYHGTSVGVSNLAPFSGTFGRLRLQYLRGLAEKRSGFGARCVAVSPHVADEVKRYYGHHCTIIENAVDTKAFSPAKETHTGGPLTGIFVGSWSLGKGVDIVWDVIHALPQVKWILVIGLGGPPSLPRGVDLMRNVPLDGMPEVYRRADFLLFPSRYEGFGYTLVEAISTGLIPVATETGCAPVIYRRAPDLERFRLPLAPAREVTSHAITAIRWLDENRWAVPKLQSAARKVAIEFYDLARWERQMRDVLLSATL